MDLFGATYGCGGKKAPVSKICHTYPAMMKLGTVIPYFKKVKKYVNPVIHPLSSTEISIFMPNNIDLANTLIHNFQFFQHNF